MFNTNENALEVMEDFPNSSPEHTILQRMDVRKGEARGQGKWDG